MNELNAYAMHEKLAANILKVLVEMAQNLPKLEVGKVHTAKFEQLQGLLPPEHHGDFNADMETCLNFTSTHAFSLAPEVVATNILPHFSTFLSSLITGNLINYRPQGCPVTLKIEVESDGTAVATIQWAYSMVGIEDVNVPDGPTGS